MNRKKILIIEDDLFAVEIYKRILARRGFETEALTTGPEIEKKLEEIKEGREEKPDLILLDLLLPGITSRRSILEEIKGGPVLKDVPVFILTNYPDPVLARKLLHQGADRFLIKTNCSPGELAEDIKEVLGVPTLPIKPRFEKVFG